jgi:hypothetical protein
VILIACPRFLRQWLKNFEVILWFGFNSKRWRRSLEGDNAVQFPD